MHNYIMKLKVLTILGTRPEIIRLSRFITYADKYFDHKLAHTGQNYSNNLKDVFFEEMNIRQPDYYLDVVGENLGETMGSIISKSYNLLNELQPDALFILGDTNSALSAISAKRLKIPIFHMEAGNRCFDMNVPEEINRKIVDHISDINLCYTENSRKYLLAEGFRKDHAMVVGSPMKEILNYYMKDITESDHILNKFGLEKHKYIVLSIHREENIDIEDNFKEIIKSLNMLCNEFSVPVLFSVHPRTLKKIEGLKLNELIIPIPALGFFDYCFLQMNSLCVLSDSGTLTEESSILRFPAVSFRTSTERPEGIECGSIVLGNIKSNYVVQSIHLAIDSHEMNKSIPNDYSDDNVSLKIIKIIQGYTPIINKITWKKF